MNPPVMRKSCLLVLLLIFHYQCPSGTASLAESSLCSVSLEWYCFKHFISNPLHVKRSNGKPGFRWRVAVGCRSSCRISSSERLLALASALGLFFCFFLLKPPFPPLYPYSFLQPAYLLASLFSLPIVSDHIFFPVFHCDFKQSL